MGQLRVSEIMSTRIVDIPGDCSVREAARRMHERTVGCALVVAGARLEGVFTERDLLRLTAEGRDPVGTPVAEVMTAGPVTVAPDCDIAHAARLMAERGVRHLPVCEEDRVLGIVSMRDVVRWGALALTFDGSGAEAQAAFRALRAEAQLET